MEQSFKSKISKDGTKLSILLIIMSLVFLYTGMVMQLVKLEQRGSFDSFWFFIPLGVMTFLAGGIIYYWLIPEEDKRKRAEQELRSKLE